MRTQTLRYRSPAQDGAPLPGTILMGSGPRTRRAYRVLGARRTRGLPALGISTWSLKVETMTAAFGRAEIMAGATHCTIVWAKR